VLAKEERDAFGKVKQQYDELLDAIALPTPLPNLTPAPAASVAAAAPVHEEDLGTGGPEPVASGAPAAPAAPAPATKKGGANPVYITDKDLLKSQGNSDEGEVDE